MLKVISSTCLRGRFHTAATNFRHGGDSNPALLRMLASLRSLNSQDHNLHKRAFFCSDTSDSGSEPLVEVEAKAEQAEVEEANSKSSSAIVPTNPRPEDYLTVTCSL